MREPETYCLGPDLHAWMRNGVMIESRGEREIQENEKGTRGEVTGHVHGAGGGGGQAERMQPLLSLGAYDIEQQRQSIRSNIQQAPAQWIVARGRRGAVTRAGTRRGGERSRSKAAHAGSPWITALIESLSDVPWSRVILLPKQLLSSVVYSHLFHPAEPEPQTPGRHFTPSRTTSPPFPTSDTYDLARSLATAPSSCLWPKFTQVSRSILSTNDDFAIRSI